MLLALIMGVGALFSVLSGQFLTGANLVEIARHSVEVGLAAVAMTLVLVSGGIDLSVGSIMGLSAVALGLSWQGGHVPLPGAVALALGVGAASGLFNGALIAYAGVPPLIGTLATMAGLRGLALGLTHGQSYYNYPDWFFGLGQGRVGPFPAQALLFAVVAAATGLALARSQFGRALYAMGANEAATALSGIRTSELKLAVYGFSGLTSALAAVVYVSRVSTAKADAGTGLELDAITAAVLGGTSVLGGEGTVVGTVLGLALLAELRNGLTLVNVPEERQAVVVGLMLIAAVWADRRLRRGAV